MILKNLIIFKSQWSLSLFTYLKYNMDLIEKDRLQTQPTEKYMKTNLHWSLDQNNPSSRKVPQTWGQNVSAIATSISGICCHTASHGLFHQELCRQTWVNLVRLKPKTNTGSWVDRKDVRASHCKQNHGRLQCCTLTYASVLCVIAD